MSFELIEAEEAHYPKALMCRALGLSRSGHHAYSTRGPSAREIEEQRVDVLVAAVFHEMRGRYGAPRIHQELRGRGICTSRKRVAASMARQGLVARAPRRWQKTTDSNHRQPAAPNLLERDFTTDAPTAPGWPTRPTCRCWAASSSWSRCSTCSRARWSDGPSATGSTRTSRTRRSAAPSFAGIRLAASSSTLIEASSSQQRRSASCSSASARGRA